MLGMYSFSIVYLFQFTHPGRGATARAYTSLQGYMFQFTHPGRGATFTRIKVTHHRRFQFTHPGRGATTRQTDSALHKALFQFTHPGRGATSSGGMVIPLASFNSRTPGGVRHQRSRLSNVRLTVSIHAPREGCDLALVTLLLVTLSFNSRTPGGVRL